jgi:hypothetical protein
MCECVKLPQGSSHPCMCECVKLPQDSSHPCMRFARTIISTVEKLLTATTNASDGWLCIFRHVDFSTIDYVQLTHLHSAHAPACMGHTQIRRFDFGGDAATVATGCLSRVHVDRRRHAALGSRLKCTPALDRKTPCRSSLQVG